MFIHVRKVSIPQNNPIVRADKSCEIRFTLLKFLVQLDVIPNRICLRHLLSVDICMTWLQANPRLISYYRNSTISHLPKLLMFYKFPFVIFFMGIGWATWCRSSCFRQQARSSQCDERGGDHWQTRSPFSPTATLVRSPLMIMRFASFYSIFKITRNNRLCSFNRYIQSTCATSGEGLYEGLDWLSNNIANKVMHIFS